MAKLVNGILGGFSGKVGNVVGSIWKGINTIRAYAPVVSNPNTAAQQEQRAKFSLVVQFLRPFTSFLRKSYKSAAIKMTAYNAAMKYNMANAITGISPDFALDYTKVRLSQGNLTGALNPVATCTEAGLLHLVWDDNSGEGDAQATDTAVVIAYNPTRKQKVEAVLDTRDTAMTDLPIPESWSGETAQTYIAFCNAEGSVYSDSLFVDAVTLL